MNFLCFMSYNLWDFLFNLETNLFDDAISRSSWLERFFFVLSQCFPSPVASVRAQLRSSTARQLNKFGKSVQSWTEVCSSYLRSEDSCKLLFKKLYIPIAISVHVRLGNLCITHLQYLKTCGEVIPRQTRTKTMNLLYQP